MEYLKPFLTFEEQIQKLAGRGIVINNYDTARDFLSKVNYYKFSGYTLFFEFKEGPDRSHRYQLGTSFEDIKNLYLFDKKLRFLIWEKTKLWTD